MGKNICLDSYIICKSLGGLKNHLAICKDPASSTSKSLACVFCNRTSRSLSELKNQSHACSLSSMCK